MSDDSSWSRLLAVLRQLGAFAVVGGVGLIVDVGVFNLLLLHRSHLVAWPMLAKTASTALAIAVNWLGNRLWTFREHRRDDTVREGIEFLAASLLGSGVALVCLGISHYVLHLTTPLDDNVSANVVGLIVGSAVRFAAYRWWVFSDRSEGTAQPGESGRVTVTVAPRP